LAGGKVSSGLNLCNCLLCKLRLASLDVRIAHVHGVGVPVHNHDRFVRVTADVKRDFHYVGHDWKKSLSASSARFSTVGQPVRYTLLFNSVSHTSSLRWAVQL